MQNEIKRPSSRLKNARRVFSYIGFALALWIVLEIVLLNILYSILSSAFPSEVSPDVKMLLSYGVLYCIVSPIVLLFLRRLPAAPPEKGRITAKHFFVFFMIDAALSYVGLLLGNLAGATLESLFEISTQNALESLRDTNLPIAALIVVIVGPLVEELLFRKAILDRTRAYGEKFALLFSSLLFAFFHMNLYQFFYAFLGGLVFGYLYLRTGKITVSYALHALYNLLFCIMPLALTQNEGYTAIQDAVLNAAPEDLIAVAAANPTALVAAALYSLFEFALIIGGFFLLGTYSKKILFKTSECQLPPDTEGSAGFINVGVAVFVVLSTLLTFLLR